MRPEAVPVAAPGRMDPDEMDAVRHAMARVLESGTYVGGAEVRRFERSFADSLGFEAEGVSVGSGLDALTLSLRALALPEGSVALVPVNDGGFAAKAAIDADLIPRPIDCGPDGNLRLAEVASGCDGAAVVVVTHLHGLVAEVEEIAAWCRPRGISVVEDCAQAHGARGIAAHGEISAFSFYPTKNLGALGDAGAIVTRDRAMADRVRGLREYGWGARFDIHFPGGRNSRMDAIQAAILRARLPHLGDAVARRRSIVHRYRRVLTGVEFLARDDESFAAHHAVVVTDDRDRLAQILDREGVGHQVHYPLLVTEMSGLTVDGRSGFPTADRLRRRMLSLPCFPGMRDEEVDVVCDVLQTWHKGLG